jgi:hypothetical protein
VGTSPTPTGAVDRIKNHSVYVVLRAASARRKPFQARIEQATIGLLYHIFELVIWYAEPSAAGHDATRHPVAVCDDECIAGDTRPDLGSQQALIK